MRRTLCDALLAAVLRPLHMAEASFLSWSCALSSPATLLHGQLPLLMAATQLAVYCLTSTVGFNVPDQEEAMPDVLCVYFAAQGQRMTHKQERWLSLLQLLRLVSKAAVLQECPTL